MKSIRSILVPYLLVLAACAGAVPPQPAEAQRLAPTPLPVVHATPEAAAATITAENVHDHVHFLASDEMRGRDTPSPELERAAEYIANHFRSLGLEPAGGDGTYFQRWPFRLQALDADRARLAFEGGPAPRTLEFGRDFFVLPGTPDAASGTAVFLGSADALPAADRLDVADRIAVVLLPGTPGGPWQRTLSRAASMLGDARAAAVVFVLDPQVGADQVGALARNLSRPERDRSLGLRRQPSMAFVREDAARPLFRAAGQDLASLRRQSGGAPVRLEGVTVRLAAPMRIVADDRPANVVAMLRGSDPALRDEYIVLTAHYDHVGVGRADASGDSIYNGADDNASGTTALMEAARAFAALASPPARSIVFLAVSGEEKGLLGSYYFSERPTVPIENVVTNINMDMVGRNSPDSIVAIGLEWSSLGPLVQGVAERRRDELGLTVSPDLWPEERFFFRSDQYHFVRQEIPALFFFSGVHEDYHRPSDTPDRLDMDKVARVARLAFYTAHEIASRPERPAWTPEGLAEVRALTAGGR